MTTSPDHTPGSDEQRITEVTERTALAWIDQYNHHMLLTVQALQALHSAFDAKFSR
jgi:hypothetical protein